MNGRRRLGVLVVPVVTLALALTHAQPAAVRGWPEVRNEMKPWTRWWWHGSAVERDSLTAQLEALRDTGVGGVELTPIYGVRGAEEWFIPYLSPAWVAMLEHTLAEARRVGLDVDMATGTGWPFGGPWVGDDLAPRSLVHTTWTLSAGERMREPVRMRQTPLVRAVGNQVHVVGEGFSPGVRGNRGAEPAAPEARPAIRIDDLAHPVTANRNLQALALEQVKYPHNLPLISLMAYGDSGQVVDLTSRVGADGALEWIAPAGVWTLYGLFSGMHGKLVERAAPGGEGNVIDHFSRDAITTYLARFDRAFAGRRAAGIRAFFNDSYEVDDAAGQADWTPRMMAEFEKRRGYDLRRHLPALFGRADENTNARVLADYRETISDLLLETFTTEWRAWAHGRGSLVRNQAHGSPASLLDLYAASDVPETEGAELQRFKWATSAAHVAGRRLVSAEAATWLGEHFRSTLADVRAAVDRFFVAGVNHIVYHGTAYSPRGEPWPGWLFYAAVAFGPQNAWWDDFPALNQYITRVQSFLQSGTPDHDVLLYYPFHEAAAVRGNALLAHFGGANPRPLGTAFEAAADSMQARGFTYDFVSDRQLRATRVAGDRLTTAGGRSYRVVVVPAARFVPLETFEHALALARDGATVVSFRDWPSDVAGYADLERKRERFRRAVSPVRFDAAPSGGVSEARVGRGRILRGDDLPALLERAGIVREGMVDRGLLFHRRSDPLGRMYFVSNPGDQPFDGWVPLATDAARLMLFDPMDGRHGNATVRTMSGSREVYVQIPARGSLIIAATPVASRETYDSFTHAGAPIAIASRWEVRFIKGGPALPGPRTMDRLVPWTVTAGEEVKSFSGTATYTTSVPHPSGRAERWALDLGRVRESARVRFNGRELGTLIGPTYRLVVPAALLAATNVLDVDVTNLSANRIADLDRRGVVWKKFYNVNFPARLPENRGADGLFTAARWTPLESGLLGPVTLTPLAVAR